MKYTVVLDPQVHQDLQRIIDWYNSKQEGLGERFYHLSKKEFESLQNNAFHYQIRYDEIRCVQVRPFPYMIHYTIIEAQQVVFVEAVIGTSENPDNFKTKS